MSGGLMSGGRMSGGRLSGGLKSYDQDIRLYAPPLIGTQSRDLTRLSHRCTLLG